MYCEEIRERIHSLIEGELDPEEINLIRIHISYCKFCREFYDELVKLSFVSPALKEDKDIKKEVLKIKRKGYIKRNIKKIFLSLALFIIVLSSLFDKFFVRETDNISKSIVFPKENIVEKGDYFYYTDIYYEEKIP